MGLEGIFDPLEWSGVQMVKEHAVKPAGPFRLAGKTLEIAVRGMNDALLLTRVNAGGRAAEVRIAPQADFDKHQRFAVEGNTVNFAATNAVIALQYAKPGARQMGSGQIFGQIAVHLFRGARGILVCHVTL
jgi:hypothetical protein